MFRTQFICGTVVSFLLCLSASAQGIDRGPFKARKRYNPRRAIVDAPFLKADEVTDEVTDNELVLGIEIKGQARAYPINMLTGPDREIINDTFGEAHLARHLVTPVPQCHRVWQRNQREETDVCRIGPALERQPGHDRSGDEIALEPQSLENVSTERLKGERLKRFIADTMTWRAWRKEHPGDHRAQSLASQKARLLEGLLSSAGTVCVRFRRAGRTLST